MQNADGVVTAGLPRAIRDALVSWNHTTEYELPSHQSYSVGAGKGLFEKTYDLGACLPLLMSVDLCQGACEACALQVFAYP